MHTESAMHGMAPGWIPRWPRSPLERGQFAVLLVLAVVTAAAWVLTMRMSHTMHTSLGHGARGVAGDADARRHIHDMGSMVMHEAGEVTVLGMSGATWSLTGFAVFVVAWAVMMAAMMFPGVAPMLLLVQRVAHHRGSPGNAVAPTSVFAAGYLLVWTIVGGITWVVVHALSELASRMGASERESWAPLALGAVLMTAGLYQWSPFKQLCSITAARQLHSWFSAGVPDALEHSSWESVTGYTVLAAALPFSRCWLPRA